MADIVPLRRVEKARKKAGKPEPKAHKWECRRCEHDVGVATIEIVQMRIGPWIKGMKIVGGTKRWVCAHCWRRGIVTEV